MFELVQHKRVYEEIIEEIISRIQAGALKIGEKLPPERVLAEQMGVSRTSLREALRSLESMGYVRSAQGGGNYINSITIENVLSPFSAMMAQNKRFAADIIEVRQHLEVHMAEMAAQNASSSQISLIYAAILNMQAEIDAGGNGIQGDNTFHSEIAKASGNIAFATIVELCAELLAESRKATLNIPGQPAKTIEDHVSIFEAIKSKNASKAGEEMLKHLINARRNLEVLDREESGAPDR